MSREQGFVFGNWMGLVTSKNVVGGILLSADSEISCDLKRADDLWMFAAGEERDG